MQVAIVSQGGSYIPIMAVGSTKLWAPSVQVLVCMCCAVFSNGCDARIDSHFQ